MVFAIVPPRVILLSDNECGAWDVDGSGFLWTVSRYCFEMLFPSSDVLLNLPRRRAFAVLLYRESPRPTN